VASSVLDIGLFSTLSTRGLLMAPLSPAIVAGVFGAAIVLALCLDQVKVMLFSPSEHRLTEAMPANKARSTWIKNAGLRIGPMTI
jgi:hypothetical protein